MRAPGPKQAHCTVPHVSTREMQTGDFSHRRERVFDVGGKEQFRNRNGMNKSLVLLAVGSSPIPSIYRQTSTRFSSILDARGWIILNVDVESRILQRRDDTRTRPWSLTYGYARNL